MREEKCQSCGCTRKYCALEITIIAGRKYIYCTDCLLHDWYARRYPTAASRGVRAYTARAIVDAARTQAFR